MRTPLFIRWTGLLLAGATVFVLILLGRTSRAPAATSVRAAREVVAPQVEAYIERLDSLSVQLRPGLLRRAENGDLYSFAVNPNELWKISPTGQKTQFNLAAIPEVRQSQIFHFVQDFAFDSSENLYVPAIWRLQNGKIRSTHFGIFSFNSEGNLQRKIELTPAMEIRRLAIDDAGNFFVVGIDAGYFQGQKKSCYLLHKYSPSGALLKQMSECPPTSNPLLINNRLNPSGFDELKLDIDVDQVWVDGERVVHVLPKSHLVRVFDTKSGAGAEASLDVPPVAPTGARARIAEIMPLADGKYLVVWQFSVFAGNTVSGSAYLTVHQSDGTLASKPWALVDEVPVFSDKLGNVYLAGKSNDGVRITRAQLSLR